MNRDFVAERAAPLSVRAFRQRRHLLLRTSGGAPHQAAARQVRKMVLDVVGQRRASPSLKGNRDAGLQQCPTEIAEAGFAPDGLWNHLL
jgi:hypothetical protein